VERGTLWPPNTPRLRRQSPRFPSSGPGAGALVDMTITPEPHPDHPRVPLAAAADDPAGRLLVAMLAAGGVIQPAAEPILAEAG
jgi:hypothetical protein